MKKLLIITLLSFNINSHADVFDDVGNFMADNKALTAVLSVTALAVAGVAMKPIGEFLAEDAAATDFMVADRVVREEELATQSFTSLAERQNGIVPMEIESDAALSETGSGIGATGNAYGFPPLEGTPLSDELVNSISMDGSFNAGVIH